MSGDNWKHRSGGMVCGSCMWFVEKVKLPSPDSPAPERSHLGRCRRHAPMAGGHGYPVVYRSDWCGDHKMDEEK